MTVIKTFKRTALKKGGVYRKSDLIEDLNGFENMASAYYDPARSNELYTFFNEGYHTAGSRNSQDAANGNSSWKGTSFCAKKRRGKTDNHRVHREAQS